ncbi:hydroxyacid dehydrogenase [Pseudoroseomonas deserti]|uniref:Hydroxyacid dehydrogenase n=1 Tax=Teichococcus deserti TaxID=1817963 RepID=A0A1V2GY83_9PROT|nr:NAD(P)-dependent oxidoreductase [Pseudoroseomonas deserti]ONG50089.1 hydroxyacid dehydrogenase [Pseudoroseomonas deserti]
MSASRPEILVAIDLAPTTRALLEASFTLHHGPTPAARLAIAAGRGAAIGGILTNGATEISAALIAALPALRIIHAQGVGHEGVDLDAATLKQIPVTHGRGANADCVADHACALVLALLRDIPAMDALVRQGGWRSGGTMRPMASGKRLGILGLGDIGGRIARRLSGFAMPTVYHNRRPVAGAAYDYAPDPVALAARSDLLVVAVPGGAGSRHVVDAAVLQALGPQGFLVNVGRGSAVDTLALIEALTEKRIAGAALDVVEGEPDLPAALRALPNLVLTPHMAGRSPESVQAAAALALANLTAGLAGAPLPTLVPGQRGRFAEV